MDQFKQRRENGQARKRIQAELKIGKPGDKYEQEADRVADRVMQMGQPEFLQMQPMEEEDEMMQPKLRMQPEEEEEEELMQPKLKKRAVIQMVCQECAEEMMQTKPENGSVSATDELTKRIIAGGGQGSRLPEPTMQLMSNALGADFSGVNVHNDATSHHLNHSLQARAFTYGSDVYFNKGEYKPDSPSGKKLLAHELTHVVQQGAAKRESKATVPHIQMDRLPCTSRKKLEVFTVNLPGSTRTAYDDIKATNDILCQCGLEIVINGGESWDTDLMDKQEPKGVLNEFKSTGNPTLEEKELLAHRPGGDVLHLYYVPALSDGNEAEAFYNSGFPTVNNGLVVSNGARIFAFAHELGHVLLDDGSHHPNKDNLMASGGVNTGKGELTPEQCAKMP